MINLIGDELWYRGHMVAMLAGSGVPATVMADFLNDLSNGELFDDVICVCSECKAKAVIPHLHDCSNYKALEPNEPALNEAGEHEESEYDCALDDVVRSIMDFNKGGLIKLSDLESVIKQLKEEDINGEATPR